MEKPRRFQYSLRTLLIGIVLINLSMWAWFTFLNDYFFPVQRCVVEGTPIETPAGPRPVETLSAGDQVLCRSSDGRIVVGKITATQRYTAARYLRFRFDDGRELCVTAEHPIFGENGWQRAGGFSAGDSVLAISATRCIESIRVEHGPVGVYDLTVSPHENFFAGGVLVHNKSVANTSSNMRQIGLAIEQYDMDFGKGYPEKLSDLYTSQILTNIKVYRRPSWRRPPISSQNQIDQETDYVYISGLNSIMGTETVILYEKPLYNEGAHVVFLGDWHVEWWRIRRLKEYLRDRGLDMVTSPGFK